jgi:hypothetical protein
MHAAGYPVTRRERFEKKKAQAAGGGYADFDRHGGPI